MYGSAAERRVLPPQRPANSDRQGHYERSSEWGDVVHCRLPEPVLSPRGHGVPVHHGRNRDGALWERRRTRRRGTDGFGKNRRPTSVDVPEVLEGPVRIDPQRLLARRR